MQLRLPRPLSPALGRDPLPGACSASPRVGYECGQTLCYLWLLVQVGVWIDVGSRYETEKNNGAGYFVEHLAFKVRCLPGLGAACCTY